MFEDARSPRGRASTIGVRALTTVETAVAIAIGGSLLATTIPTFVENLRVSRLAEPIDGLKEIATRASILASGCATELAYPESVGLTPAKVPAGQRVLDPPGTWDHPTWRHLDFGFTTPHAFSFAFESHNSSKEAHFVARAQGDLDGDGVLSTFELPGEVKGNATPTVGTLYVHREVE